MFQPPRVSSLCHKTAQGETKKSKHDALSWFPTQRMLFVCCSYGSRSPTGDLYEWSEVAGRRRLLARTELLPVTKQPKAAAPPNSRASTAHLMTLSKCLVGGDMAAEYLAQKYISNAPIRCPQTASEGAQTPHHWTSQHNCVFEKSIFLLFRIMSGKNQHESLRGQRVWCANLMLSLKKCCWWWDKSIPGELLDETLWTVWPDFNLYSKPSPNGNAHLACMCILTALQISGCIVCWQIWDLKGWYNSRFWIIRSTWQELI